MKSFITTIAVFGSVCSMLVPLVQIETAIAAPSLLHLNQSVRIQPQILAFTDISGVDGETEIRQLAQLGVLEPASGGFRPRSSITRAEFITWLVKSYNALQTHNVRKPTLIRLPDRSRSAFRDVSPSHPAFRYIQAAYDAGFLAGYEDGTFRPDAVLTREEMIVLKSPVDSRGSGNSSRSAESLRNFIQQTKGFQDADRMSERYLTHIAFDLGNAASGRNFERVYGARSRYEPQKAVSRAEAAVALSQFRRAGTAAQAIEKLNRR